MGTVSYNVAGGFFIAVYEFFKYFAGWIALKLLTPLSEAFKPHFCIQFRKRIIKRTNENITAHNFEKYKQSKIKLTNQSSCNHNQTHFGLNHKFLI